MAAKSAVVGRGGGGAPKKGGWKQKDRQGRRELTVGGKPGEKEAVDLAVHLDDKDVRSECGKPRGKLKADAEGNGGVDVAFACDAKRRGSPDGWVD